MYFYSDSDDDDDDDDDDDVDEEDEEYYSSDDYGYDDGDNMIFDFPPLHAYPLPPVPYGANGEMYGAGFGHSDLHGLHAERMEAMTARMFEGDFDESDSEDGSAFDETEFKNFLTLVSADKKIDESTCPLHKACAVGDLDEFKKILSTFPDFCIDLCDPISRASAIEIACLKGSVACVTLLLEKGSQMLPLSEAIKGGSPQVVEILLKKGANAKEFNAILGEARIHEAAQKGNAEIVQLLLQHGADPNQQGTSRIDCSTPLHEAAHEGHAEVVKVLLQAGARVDTLDSQESTPLLHAAENGHLEVARILLNKGAQIDVVNRDKETPLGAAVRSGNAEVVSLLLQKGADPTTKYQGGSLFAVACKSNLNVVKELHKVGAAGPITPSIIQDTASHGKTDILEWLLDQNKSRNKPSFPPGYIPPGIAREDLGEITLLSSACTQGHLDMVKMLVGRGVPVTKYGVLSAACAAQKENLEIVQFLLDSGARASTNGHRDYYSDSDSDDDYGYFDPARDRGSALGSAVSRGHAGIVRVLLESEKVRAREGEKSIVTPGVMTTLCGSKGDHVEILRTLWENGAAQSVDQWNSQCLTRAIKSLNVHIAQFLLEHDALAAVQQANQAVPFMVPNIYGHTAPNNSPLRHLCMTRGSKRKKVAIGKLLIQHGAVIDSRSSTGDTALLYAVKSGSTDLVWLLTTAGANLNFKYYGRKTIWDICGENKKMHAALLHNWAPEYHHNFPQPVKDAIKCLLLIAHRQKWIFGTNIMHELFGYIAYDWTPLGYQPKPAIEPIFIPDSPKREKPKIRARRVRAAPPPPPPIQTAYKVLPKRAAAKKPAATAAKKPAAKKVAAEKRAKPASEKKAPDGPTKKKPRKK